MAQDELTKEQLQALGHVDISISVFSNNGQYGFEPDKTVAMLKQLKPPIAMPAHYEPDTADGILKELGIEERSEADELLVTKAEIDAQKKPRYVLLQP